MSTINERIRIIRKMNNLNQQQFAQILGVSQTHISKIEAGKDAPSRKLLKSICIEFNINPGWIESEIGNINQSEFCEDILIKDCLVKTKKYLLNASKQEKMLYSNLLIQFPDLIKSINIAELNNTDGIDDYLITTLFDILLETMKYTEYLNKETRKIKHSENTNNKIDDIFYISDTYINKISEELKTIRNIFLEIG